MCPQLYSHSMEEWISLYLIRVFYDGDSFDFVLEDLVRIRSMPFAICIIFSIRRIYSIVFARGNKSVLVDRIYLYIC